MAVTSLAALRTPGYAYALGQEPAGTGIAGSVDPHPRNGLARTGPTGGYPATVFQRFPRLTLVGIAVASFVVVVALIQLAGGLAT